ncbi:MAG: FeoA family protein [Syntrophomonas sp.]
MPYPSKIIPLSELPLGSFCRIASINTEGLLRRRMLDLGLIPGTIIESVRKSPSGDPTAYRVRGSLIALRSENADQITVYYPALS